MSATEETEPRVEEKQCRICLDGPDPDLGRLIRPCLCRGSISHVHLKCLQKWRTMSASSSAFYSCPQCKYRYHFARTRVVGIATNPVVIAALSAILFTVIVLFSSFFTTFFMSVFDGPSYYSWYISPIDVAKDLVRAALGIIQDESGLFDEVIPRIKSSRRTSLNDFASEIPRAPPGLVKRLLKRFLLGLPLVGASSLIHMMLTLPFLGPMQWLARYRGSRRRRENERDLAAIIIIALLVVGAARALYKVYTWTERWTKVALNRAEDAILEVG